SGIGALESVEADDIDILVLAIGTDCARRGRSFSDDFDHIAFAQAERVHEAVREACEAAAAVGGGQARDLNLARFHAVDGVGVRHICSSPASSCRWVTAA